MNTIESRYLGGLRTTAIHVKSGQNLVSDAPTDNNGKGESFSPTDLVATALGSCMTTVMGIYAQKQGIDLEGLQWHTLKVMSANPRKIARIVVEFHGTPPEASNEELNKLKDIALHCPVALSLHPDLEQEIVFNF